MHESYVTRGPRFRDLRYEEPGKITQLDLPEVGDRDKVLENFLRTFWAIARKNTGMLRRFRMPAQRLNNIFDDKDFETNVQEVIDCRFL